MTDERDQMRHRRLRPQRVSFEVERDIAAACARGIGPAAGTAVNGDGTPGLFRRRVDRMKQRMSEAIVIRVVDQHDLYHARIAGMPPDLRGGLIRKLTGDENR